MVSDTAVKITMALSGFAQSISFYLRYVSPKSLTKPMIHKISKKSATGMPVTCHKSTIQPIVLDLFRNIASMKDDGMLVANPTEVKL